jgi:hypothetical protein
LRAAALGATKPAWKKFLQPHVERLHGTGFDYEEGDGSFFFPVRIETEALAQAVVDDTLELALAPLRLALDQLLKAKPQFDAVLRDAKSQFGV